MRIEETAALCDRVEAEIRNEVPPAEFGGIIDNIGLLIAASTFLQQFGANRNGRCGHYGRSFRQASANSRLCA